MPLPHEIQTPLKQLLLKQSEAWLHVRWSGHTSQRSPPQPTSLSLPLRAPSPHVPGVCAVAVVAEAARALSVRRALSAQGTRGAVDAAVDVHLVAVAVAVAGAVATAGGLAAARNARVTVRGAAHCRGAGGGVENRAQGRSFAAGRARARPWPRPSERCRSSHPRSSELLHPEPPAPPSPLEPALVGTAPEHAAVSGSNPAGSPRPK